MNFYVKPDNDLEPENESMKALQEQVIIFDSTRQKDYRISNIKFPSTPYGSQAEIVKAMTKILEVQDEMNEIILPIASMNP